MKRWYQVFLALLLVLVFRPGNGQSVSSPTAEPPLLATGSTTTNSDELSATGLLRQVQDTDYPYCTLHIDLAGRPTPGQFVINLNELPAIRLSTLTSLIGKPVSFQYTSKRSHTLLDIQINGRSLLTTDPAIVTASASKVTGVLGVDGLTTGDEPNRLLITAPNGVITEFRYYISSDLLEVNGTTVDAFYNTRTVHTIKALQPVN
ncbi:hypothetical protein JYG30_02610 [Fibrella sp. USSR17]